MRGGVREEYCDGTVGESVVALRPVKFLVCRTMFRFVHALSLSVRI